MSCIEIHLIKVSPIAVAAPAIDVHIHLTASPPIEIPIEEIGPSVAAELPVVIVEKAKKPRVKRRSSAASRKKSVKKKKS